MEALKKDRIESSMELSFGWTQKAVEASLY